MECLGTSLGELALHLMAELVRHRWPQVELRERRSQIQAGPSDHDRPPALGQQRIDLAMCGLGIAAGAELLPGLDERQQPVFELLAFLCRRGAAQSLQPAIDLDRVAVDRDGVLAALPKALGDRDRDSGLSDGGGAEKGEDPQAARLSRRSCPESVVEVAPVISTSTSSPGAAVPSKLTVLL